MGIRQKPSTKNKKRKKWESSRGAVASSQGLVAGARKCEVGRMKEESIGWLGLLEGGDCDVGETGDAEGIIPRIFMPNPSGINHRGHREHRGGMN